MMQLFADTSGRRGHVPASSEVPARGAALFGAVAAGAFRRYRAAIAATRPSRRAPTRPTRTAKADYDRVYAIYRRLYETLGRSEVELLHGLKRIRAEAGASELR